MAPPPLVGDANGNYRVHIVGNSGAGKESISCPLNPSGNVCYPSFDTLFWKPGWKESTNDELRAKVEQALANAPNGWVVDGNYRSKIGTVVQDQSTDVIWLDPPLALYLPRIIWRTFVRLLGLREPCSPGCPEMVSKLFFSKESIVWWCITHHRIPREQPLAAPVLLIRSTPKLPRPAMRRPAFGRAIAVFVSSAMCMRMSVRDILRPGKGSRPPSGPSACDPPLHSIPSYAVPTSTLSMVHFS
ncbi:hypothetical protein MVEN_00256900 [Mycena venus]|uniref:Adenylate kinase n=1 Tax=Mycena venus TaxID=2733690 RepID=A0A8H6Z3P9_9AGAR|nr:hypothetical protein MVEN_00256900 [Mycena venus]